MEEYLKRQIMTASRHQIIYGYNTRQRQEFLQSLEEAYPLKINSNTPTAIYMKDYNLPKLVGKTNSYETLSTAGEFLEFTIIENIITKILTSSITLDEKSQVDFVNRIIKLFGNKSHEQLTDIKRLKELRTALLESKNFYRKHYLNQEEKTLDINKLPIPFITTELVVPKIKKSFRNGFILWTYF